MKLSVHTFEGGASGEIELADAVFGIAPGDIRRDILHRMVVWQLAKRRAGTQRTQLRGEVNRTKKKSVKQKGSGGARHGARTAGIFVGGAKANGPKPRSYEFSLNKKVKQMAMRHALSAKAGAGELIIVEDAVISAPKTKTLVKALENISAPNVLVIGGAVIDEGFARAARNLPSIDVLPVQGANVYDMLRREKLVLTRAAAEALQARLLGAPVAEEAA